VLARRFAPASLCFG